MYLYGLAIYALAVVTLVYGICFVGSVFVARNIDNGKAAPLAEALFINVLLISLFGLQHSVMARRSFKKVWTRIIPPYLERSTYLLSTCIVLIMLFVHWRPIPGEVWRVDASAGILLIRGVFWLGVGILFTALFLIDHLSLVGLRQIHDRITGREYREPAFETPFLYKYVRHPQMTGVLLAFWAAPVMTWGHLFFAVTATLYIRVAVIFEERDLVRTYGGLYESYRSSLPMFFPWPGKRMD
jgi:protein-S-isoprenylcysteine O-methyltransferase Ste14